MDLHLSGKVFIVTGGAKGIGASISTTLAAEGAWVLIVGRNKADNVAMADSIVKTGGKASYFTAELAKPEACRDAVDFAIEKYARIDGLVNNAGFNDGIGLEKGSPDAFMQSLQNNLSHYYNLAHYCLPHLKLTKGNIVNIGSKVAETGQGNTSGYAASKGAVNALTREWAVELLQYGIRVNTVLPAEVWTPLYENWLNSLPDPKATLEKIVDKIPLGKRMTTAQEIADTTVFLLSEKSAHTTGQILFVDGGYSHLDRSLI